MGDIGDPLEADSKDAVVEEVALIAARLPVQVAGPAVGIVFAIGVNLRQQAVENGHVVAPIEKLVGRGASR